MAPPNLEGGHAHDYPTNDGKPLLRGPGATSGIQSVIRRVKHT